jgi:hypothetical protein
MKKFLPIFCLIAHAALAQWAIPVATGAIAASAGGGPTPTFVSETSVNSTLTNAVGTNPSGQTACSAYSYCIPAAEPVLSGNLGIVAGHFANSTTLTPTNADDKSDTWTCTTGGSKDSGTNEWPFLCYGANLTSGAHKNTTTFGTTRVTQVTEKLSQFYNVAASSPLDGSIGSCAGTSSSTANCASVTPTVANDLIYVLVCRAGTPAVTSFTAGSGFTLITEDINDGCASEYEVDGGTGSITPTMTMASSSTYVEIVAAFKSASAGTAPSGWYADKLMSWSSPSSSSTSWPFQFTSTGNLLYNATTCGTLTPSATSDSVNGTWTATGATNTNSNVVTNERYVAGAAANSTGLITVTTTGTGDCTFKFYSFQGAPATPKVTRAAYAGNSLVTSATLPLVYPSPDGGSTQTNYLNSPTNGLVIMTGGLQFNTGVGISTPTGGIWDAAYYGGMALSGPEPVDENNLYGHSYISGGDQAVWADTLSSATLEAQLWNADTVAFFGSGVSIAHWTENTGASSTTLAVTVPSTSAGNLLAIAVGVYNSTAITISTVKCNDSGTTSFTQLSGATSTGSGHGATSIWYILSAPSACTTVTITASASAANLEAMYDEVQKYSGSWATDGGGETTNGTGSGTTLSGPSLTTTGSADFCTATFAVSDTVATTPKSGNEYNYGNVLYALGTQDAAASLITTLASAHVPSVTDSGSGDSFSASHGCYK